MQNSLTRLHASAIRAFCAAAVLLACICWSYAARAQTTVVEYIHTDALGSPVAVTNEAGQVIERTQWEPYGAAIGKPNYDGPGYTGHVMDGATGLTYMQQRYYDPGIGRFLSVDPVTANSGTGANFNRYWYANNNPYKFTDPDGRLPIFIPVFAGVMLLMHSEYANAPALGEATQTVSPAEAAGAFASALPPGRAAAGIKMGIDAGKIANNRAKSVEKGVPKNQIGPSGKPKVHTVQHSTRKEAKEAAQHETPPGGRIRNDAHPQDGQKPHFQAENAKGENVKPVVHHCKPNKAC